MTLETLINNLQIQHLIDNTEDIADITKAVHRHRILMCTTPETNAYQNLHEVLRNHPTANHPTAVQIYTEIASLWAAEARSAQSCYDEEDKLFIQTPVRGYIPSTPHEQWFMDGTNKEIGGFPNKQERARIRTSYLNYCKEREAEYKQRALQ